MTIGNLSHHKTCARQELKLALGHIAQASQRAAPASESGALEALRMLDRRFRLVRVVSQSKDPDRAVCDYEATLTLTERVRIERLDARKEGTNGDR